MNAELAMTGSGVKKTIFCVLSDEQRSEFEQGLGREIPPGTQLEFESDPDVALDRAGELRPGLVIVGMTIEPMEGLEFLALLMARYQDFHHKVIVLPELGDPFPPMLQYRDRASGRSVTQELDSDDVVKLIRSIAAPNPESQQVPKGAPSKVGQSPSVPQREPSPSVPRREPSPSVPRREPVPNQMVGVAHPFKPAEPPSGVQKVAPPVRLEPTPVKEIKPEKGPSLAALVMQPVPGASAQKSAGPVALADTMLARPPAVHTPLEGPSLPAPTPEQAQPPRQVLPPEEAPPPAPVALEPPQAAAAPPAAPIPAPGAAIPPVTPGFASAPAVNPTGGAPAPAAPATAPALHAPTGAGGVTLPGRTGPLAKPAARPSLLDRIAIGPLKDLPPDKRWIAWAALVSPLVLLVLLIALLLLSSGGSSDQAPTSRAEAPHRPAAAKLTVKKPSAPTPARTEKATEVKQEAPEEPAAETRTTHDLMDLTTLPLSFAQGDHEYSIQDRTKLDEMAEKVIAALKANPKLRLEVGGHTSEEGSKRFNKLLGKQRAQQALAYLIDRGVPVERAIIKNYQSTLPTESARPGAQRRVTVRLVP